MKKLLPIFFILILSSCSKEPESFTGPFLIKDGLLYHQETDELVTGYKVRYLLGVKLSKEEYSKGKKDGLSENFFENGLLRSRENFKDGKKDGLSEIFHYDDFLYSPDTSKLHIRQYYKDGVPHGTRETFTKSGKLSGQSNYLNGELDGYYMDTFINGSGLRSEGHYVKGKREGEWIDNSTILKPVTIDGEVVGYYPGTGNYIDGVRQLTEDEKQELQNKN